MTKTKHSLITSAIALLLCCSMLIGTTFAWFTDSVTSSNNIIKSGTLDITLSYLTAKEDPTSETATWKEIVNEENKDGDPIFNYTLWEPGYTEVRHIKIENNGSLALKYLVNFIPKDEQGKKITDLEKLKVDDISLADVIDVYYFDPAVKISDRNDLEGIKPLGTLSEVLTGLSDTASGTLLADGKDIITLALKMKEEAGNEYQDKYIGASFDIQLLATQLDFESDSIDNKYDENPVSADTWDGTVDTSWYNDTDTEFTITTAEQLAGLAELVDDGNTFEGKTIKLGSDLNLYCVDANGETVSFDPIGYGYDVVFKGTFDGQGHTISNMYQNGWALGLDYSTEGGGLFASVVDATIKNVIIDKAEIVMECIDMGAVVGYSYGNCTYENIIVKNSTIANYNRYTGGVVGEVNGKQTFKNVDVIDTTVSALWGTYDASLGGIVGGKWGNAELTFEDCDVSAKLDAFNDACSNYQYYNYRLCGMLIGMSEEVTDGTATASYLTCKNCTVTYGDWVNYTYCESESYGKGSYAAADEWKFKRVQAGYATDGVDANHTHDTDESHEELLTFDQLFGGDKGVSGGKTHDGVTVIYPNN